MTNPYEKNPTFDAAPVRSEVLNPAEFLRLVKTAPADIASSRPVPPKLGSDGFGGIEVTYQVPKYRIAV